MSYGIKYPIGSFSLAILAVSRTNVSLLSLLQSLYLNERGNYMASQSEVVSYI